MNRQLVIKNEISEIARLSGFIEEVGEELDLSPALVLKLNMVLEEAVSNIILYAFPYKAEEEITINLEIKESVLVFIIMDKGIEFDPTQSKEVDIRLPLEERPIGGLGIFLIKKIMNEVKYQRIDNTNIFTLKKSISNQVSPE